MKENRIALYRFLSIGFTYPEKDFSDIIQKSIELMSKSYTALNKESYKLTGIKNLRKGLKELSNIPYEEWQAKYTSLFISNFPTTSLHPYESFYKQGIVGGEISEMLDNIYKSCGLEIFDDREMPDYLVFELEFAAFLIENEKSCKPLFEEFFFNHLFDWAPKFFEDVMNFSSSPLLYKALSEIGVTFINKEKKIIKEFIDEGEGLRPDLHG